MRKLLIAALCVALMGLAACNQDKGKPRVAVVDADKVLTDCQAGKKGMDALRALSEDISAKLKKMEAEMGEDKGQDKMMAFQQALATARSEVNGEQMRLMGILQKAFEEAVENYRSSNGLDVVLLKEQTLSVAPEADATKAIVAAMDAKNIDLSRPAPKAEEKPAEAAPAAPAAPAEKPAEKAADKPAEGKAQ